MGEEWEAGAFTEVIHKKSSSKKKKKKILKSYFLSVPGAKPCGSLFFGGGECTNFSDLSMLSNDRA